MVKRGCSGRGFEGLGEELRMIEVGSWRLVTLRWVQYVVWNYGGMEAQARRQ